MHEAITKRNVIHILLKYTNCEVEHILTIQKEFLIYLTYSVIKIHEMWMKAHVIRYRDML